jgi:hypothetical protein
MCADQRWNRRETAAGEEEDQPAHAAILGADAAG